MSRKLRGRILGIALCSAVTCCLAFQQSAHATQYWTDTIPYADGNIVTNSGGNWTAHSGGTGLPANVLNNRVELESGSTSRADVNRTFTALALGGTRYAAFHVVIPDSSGVPSGSEYFAHFLQGTSTFRARVYLMPAQSGGNFRLGVGDTGVPTGGSIWGSDLSFNTYYRVVIQYSFDGTTKMWINPVDENSTSVAVTGTSGTAIAAFALRQGGSSCKQIVDDICVADTFAEVVACGDPPPVVGACCDGGACTAGQTSSQCTTGGGIWLGAGTTCETDVCTAGACCIPDGQGGETCTQTFQYDCETNLGGFFQGINVPCTNPNPCGPTGACCQPDFSCTNFLTQEECTFLNPLATWFVGQTCALVCGPTGACCELNGTCTLNVTNSQCTATNGQAWYLGASSCPGCTAVTPKNVIISEYYEGAGSQKAIELYNPGPSAIDLTGHLLALYSNGSPTPSNTFSLNGVSIAAGAVKVFVNTLLPAGDIPDFDENTAIVAGGVINFNGDDAIGVIFIDASTVIDIFGIPSDGDLGPRGSDPYLDSDWERKCFVTTGTDDFDSCNFDDKKDCAGPHSATCPRGTNPALTCVDGAHADEWYYYGRTDADAPGAVHHTLGVHDCTGPLPTGACCPPIGEARGAGCDCPGNLNGDNVVNLADVPFFVTALLNNTYDICADMQPNGADNGGDIQAFVVAVLAQTSCSIDVCTVMTQGQCLAVGGTYWGDGTSCDPDPCPVPPSPGACCLTTGCQDDMDQADCITAGGFFFGYATVCAGRTCINDTTNVVINEIRTDQTSTDNSEYFELAGPPGTLLNGLTYLVIGDTTVETEPPGNVCSGNLPGNCSGNIERVVDLTGQMIPANGRFLAAAATFDTASFTQGARTPDYVFSLVNNVFENNDNVTHMLVQGFTGQLYDLVDSDRDGTLNLTMPWAVLNDWVTLTANASNPPTGADNNPDWFYDFSSFGPGAIVPPNGTFVFGHVYRLSVSNADGPGADWNGGAIDPLTGVDTPGFVNATLGACCDGVTCSEISAGDCAAISGAVFYGSGTNCDGNLCDATCANIATVKGYPDGASVKVCGIVSTDLDEVTSATTASINIEDNSGVGSRTGIFLVGTADYINNTVNGTSNVGDRVQVIGRLSSFNGQRQVNVADIANITEFQNLGFVGVSTVPAVNVSDFDNLSATAEDLEGEVVRVECVEFVDGDGTTAFIPGTAGKNYILTGSGGEMTARLATGTYINGQEIPAGPVNVTGVFGQFDNATPFDSGYQLLLMTFSDIEVVQPGNQNCPIPTGCCCLGDETTPDVTKDFCVNTIGGVYLGNGSNCDDGCPTADPSCVIISEVLDGDITGGVPKFVEITNTGDSPYRFPAGGIIVFSNGAPATTVDVNLTGLIIFPGQSYVVVGTGNSGRTVFESVYDSNYAGGPIIADRYASGIDGNGDDAYALTDASDGSTIFDIYGQILDGTGTPWEYTDSVAVRNQSASSANGGTFNVADWTITDISGADDAAVTANLRTLTTPQSHVFDPCGGAVCNEGAIGNLRALVRCDLGSPACTGGQTYCQVYAEALATDVPANCEPCLAAINGQFICVPCNGPSCTEGTEYIFRWDNFDGNGGSCYFKGTVQATGSCLSVGACSGSFIFNEN